jgi:hypothetical protein
LLRGWFPVHLGCRKIPDENLRIRYHLAQTLPAIIKPCLSVELGWSHQSLCGIEPGCACDTDFGVPSTYRLRNAGKRQQYIINKQSTLFHGTNIALPQRRKRRGCLIYGTIVAIWQLPSLKGPLPRPVLNRGAAPSQTNNTPLSLYLQPLTTVSPPEQEAFEPTPIPTQFPSRCLPANIPNLAVE